MEPGCMNNEENLDAAIKRLFQKLFEIEPESVIDRTRRGEPSWTSSEPSAI